MVVPSSRLSHTISRQDVDDILCHRSDDGLEIYLIRWKTIVSRSPRSAVISWHPISELAKCLDLVQKYIENQSMNDAPHLSLQPLNRKRKSPDHEPQQDHAVGRPFGLLSPLPSHVGSMSPKPPLSSVEAPVYNGFLHRKDGRIFASQIPRFDSKLPEIDATLLPTPEMIQISRASPMTSATRAVRLGFLQKLRHVKGLYLENKVDSSTPSLSFQFINQYTYAADVFQTPDDLFEGCQECRPNMGQNVGCEDTQKCDCLEYANVDEEKLKNTNMALYNSYMQRTSDDFDTRRLPKRFPYTKPNVNNPRIPQKLIAYYRESRFPIYECNYKCRCGPRCKNRLVQKGRQVPLTIFRTSNGRGWGVYCNVDLVEGQFIDTYLGEVLTNQEADRREDAGGSEKNSYLYALDKFVGEGDVTIDTCYVVDGQYMGGPTRFINHSCEPNCRQFSVSYNKHDNRLYHLAFFAYEDIPAGVELTFDYMDLDEVEEDEALLLREAAMRDPQNADRVRCNCGTRKCRGFLWKK